DCIATRTLRACSRCHGRMKLGRVCVCQKPTLPLLSCASAGKVATPTFTPDHYSGCQRWKMSHSLPQRVALSIYVWGFGVVGGVIANNSTIPVGRLGNLTLQAQARKLGMADSDVAHTSYTYCRPCHQ